MNKKKIRIIHLVLSAYFILAISTSAKSQMNGSLFLLPDNMYAQMLNPAYSRDDNRRILAFPGIAGLSFRNSANFRFTDFVYTRSSGETVLDFNRIALNGNSLNSASIYLEIPVFYYSVPVKKGMFSMYYKEKVQSTALFPGTAMRWFENGNFPDAFRDFNTGNISFRFLGTKELAVGITHILSNKVRAGIRGKLIFGSAFFEVNDLNYGIYTSEYGDQVLLTSEGSGKLALKFPVETTSRQKINSIPLEKSFKNYLLNYSSPGLATDIGISIEMDRKNQYSLAVNDLGFFYSGINSKKFTLNGNYLFRGIDITNVISNRDEKDYISPLDLMLVTKDSIREVYRPGYSESIFFTGLSPKLFMQYTHKFNSKISAGAGNQTVFQKGNLLNIFSINALYSNGGLSSVASISLYNAHSLTFGGGIQWTNKNAQFFVFTDNLLAIYHPAAQKSFSLTFGMNFLMDHDFSTLKKKLPNRKGIISPSRPFYKRYK